MTSSSIPLFPLPSTVLFPNVFLPLHIFEPRYRQMVADALSGDRLIGMTLLQPGYEAEYEGRPAIYPVGCSGMISQVERLPDGRFNIILRGLEKFRILGEETPPPGGRLYRRATVTTMDEAVPDADRARLREARQQLQDMLASIFEGVLGDSHLPDAMPDEDLVNALAQYLEFDPLEKQALLECPGVLARCRSMVELLEMKRLLDKAPPGRGMVH